MLEPINLYICLLKTWVDGGWEETLEQTVAILDSQAKFVPTIYNGIIVFCFLKNKILDADRATWLLSGKLGIPILFIRYFSFISIY